MFPVLEGFISVASARRCFQYVSMFAYDRRRRLCRHCR